MLSIIIIGHSYFIAEIEFDFTFGTHTHSLCIGYLHIVGVDGSVS